MSGGKSKPLRVMVKGGELVISIGVETLAWAYEQSEECQRFDEESGDFLQTVAVLDPGGFAVDVKREIQREEENGNTELYKFLDRMCESAVDDGSTSVEHIEKKTPAFIDVPFSKRSREWRKKGKP